MNLFKPTSHRAGWLVCCLAGLLASHGCGKAPLVNEESAPPFSFRALDLQQRNSEGQPAWTLTSPEARYDLRSSVARALRPSGVIFEKGQPLYKLAATTGTVINDGAAILLEGEIRLQRLGKNPLQLTAERVLWIPRESLMRFERTPQVRNLQNRLTAETATLHLDRDLLELRGQPRLEHWSRPFALNGRPPDQPPEIQSTLQAVDWHPGSGELKGVGPVKVSRRPPQSPANRPPQQLSAARLEGNTLKQLYTLQGPVQMDDPVEKSWFRGGALTFNTSEGWLTTGASFQAQQGPLQVQGAELRLDVRQSLATIGRDCKLQQPGETLQSQRCQWNWKSRAVQAEGDVVYRRQASDQLTRAQRLEGQLGPQGSVMATHPGGQVFSQLRVPRRAGAPQPQKARPKPEPIVF